MGVYQFLQSMKGVPVIGELGQGIRHGNLYRNLSNIATATKDSDKNISAVVAYLQKHGITPNKDGSPITIDDDILYDLTDKKANNFDTFIKLMKGTADEQQALEKLSDNVAYKIGRNIGQYPEAYAIGVPVAYLGGRAIFSGDDNANNYSNNYAQYVQGVPQAQPIVTNTPAMMNGVPVTQQTVNQPVYITNPNTGQVIPTNIPLPVLNDEEITRQKEYLQKKIATDLVTYRALEQMRVPPNNTQGI